MKNALTCTHIAYHNSLFAEKEWLLFDYGIWVNRTMEFSRDVLDLIALSGSRDDFCNDPGHKLGGDDSTNQEIRSIPCIIVRLLYAMWKQKMIICCDRTPSTFTHKHNK